MEPKMINTDGHILPYDGDKEPANGIKIENNLFIEVNNIAERVYVEFMVNDYGFRTTDSINNCRDFPFVIEINKEKFIRKHNVDIHANIFTFDTGYRMIEPFCEFQNRRVICGYNISFKNECIVFHPSETRFHISILESCHQFLKNNYTVESITLQHTNSKEIDFNQAELHKFLEKYKEQC